MVEFMALKVVGVTIAEAEPLVTVAETVSEPEAESVVEPEREAVVVLLADSEAEAETVAAMYGQLG